MTSHADNASPSTTCTTCPYCGVGCGVTVEQKNGDVSVAGDPSHPANFGKLCSKGFALAETLGYDNRLTAPRINNSDVSWADALDRIASEFKAVIDEYGARSVGFYVSGQLLTEDYYVVNKFVKGYLGTANIDTNSRLCMASSVAGHKRAFGSDTVPGCYEDLELANLLVLVGSNLAWCHPVLFRRIEAARENNPDLKVVVIDPRKTATAEMADLHLPIMAGGECDAALFAGLLRYLVENEAVDYPWVEQHVNQFDEAYQASLAWSPNRVSDQTGLSLADVLKFYQWFLNNKKVVTLYSQGVNQSSCGTDTVNSIINVHLATARIGKPGAGPFSITGQPNAMGGREVGGLANMLAAHMDIENDTHRGLVQRFWNSPSIASKPGLKAVNLFDAVADGRIKALWIMATNPADSMPLGNEISRAIADCPFVVVSDVVSETDTLSLATVQLPALAWSEKDGTVTNSERRISRQRSFRTGPLDAKPDWWALCEVAKRMGFADAFTYRNASEIFAEHAALSGYENRGSRDFDIGAYAALSAQEYDDLAPFQWPKPAQMSAQSNADGYEASTNGPTAANDGLSASDNIRFFSEGGFYTPDRKARMVVLDLPGSPKASVRAIQSARAEGGVALQANGSKVSRELPVILNTGRIRDQWHTLTRTGYVPKLSSHLAEPFVELCRDDADLIGAKDASLIDLSSVGGVITVRALITERVTSGTVFVPMHWSNVFASNARVNVLVQPNADPVSGQPALKSQQVRIKATEVACYGYLISRVRPKNLGFLSYWALSPIANGWRVEFASKNPPDAVMLSLVARSELSLRCDKSIHSEDEKQGYFNACWFSDDQLMQAVYLASHPVAAPRETVNGFFSERYTTFSDRVSVLAGCAKSGQVSQGATVCSCMGVGKYTIQAAIRSGATCVTSVGEHCGAGTQCGSCQPEIKTLLRTTRETSKSVQPLDVVA